METPTTEERAPKILGRGVKKLACNLTDAELLERGQKIASVKQELDNHIEQTKATAKTMSARKAELDAEVSSIATALRTKQEMRDVEYREEADFISGRAVTIRNDTNATLTSRPLTPDERQERLFGEGATEKTIPDRPEEVPPVEGAAVIGFKGKGKKKEPVPPPALTGDKPGDPPPDGSAA